MYSFNNCIYFLQFRFKMEANAEMGSHAKIPTKSRMGLCKSTWTCVHTSREQTKKTTRQKNVRKMSISLQVFLRDKQRRLIRSASRPRTAVATMPSWRTYLTLALVVGTAAAARLKVDLRPRGTLVVCSFRQLLFLQYINTSMRSFLEVLLSPATDWHVPCLTLGAPARRCPAKT